MNTLLRKIANWKGRRKSAQVIVFDGGAEVERTRSFLKGGIFGVCATLLIVLLSAPQGADAELVRQLTMREEMLRESNERLEKTMQVTGVCLETAQNLERVLGSYNSFFRSGTRAE